MFDWFRRRRQSQPALAPALTASAPAPPEPAPAPPPDGPAMQLFRARQYARAEQTARSQLAAAPADYEAHLVVALVALQRQRPAEALKALDRAMAADRSRPEAHLQLGLLHANAGRFDEALKALQAAVACDQRQFEPQFRLAGLLRDMGLAPQALQAYRAALAIDPHHAEGQHHIAGLLRDAGKTHEAVQAFQEAVHLSPEFGQAWFDLGMLLRELGRLEEAVDALQRSLTLDPKRIEAHYWLGNALMGEGNSAAAVAAYRGALRLNAQYLRARWGLTMAQIDPIPASNAARDAAREAFGVELDKLASWCRINRPSDGFNAVAATQPFYLAYQDRSNRELLTRYGNLCAELMAPWQKKAGLPPAQRSGAPRRRVGIVSAHIHNHSVWNAIVRGWVEHFDATSIELHLFHTGSQRDDETGFAGKHAARVHAGPHDWSSWARTIADSGLDAIVYPEIGMDSITTKLAALRLAPLQLASWGHPETTGLPTIDVFVSAQGMEPPDAAQHYSERLALLPGLGCCYRRFGTVAQRVDLTLLGMHPDARFVLCPGVPFKYAPQHDEWLVEIARRIAPCRLLFFHPRPQALSRRLEQRLQDAFERAGLEFDAHAIFIPWQNQAVFFGLMARAELMLDTPGFSGFNTTMQAIECGLPVVAHEGAFLRGRFASGILRQLGFDECVAQTRETFVEQVAQLCSERKQREALRAQLVARREPLFNNVAGATAMQRLLLDS